MNDIASHVELPIEIIGKYLSKCIDDFSTSFPSNQKESLIKIDDESGLIDMEDIHQIIAKKLKQYINIKNRAFKA